MKDRMPPLTDDQMDDAQRRAAAALVAGPRKGVFGPFVPLMRSPELLDRMQRVGEYLRFGNSLPPKLNELAMLLVARHTTNQFEWAVHHPNAVKAGVARATLDLIEQGRDPVGMPEDEEMVCDFCTELLRGFQVSDATYARVLKAFGERGIMDLVGTVGYFVAICMAMNVAGTPAPESDVPPLVPLTRR
jgi:4-carboxymuconolactone decarboxylase